MVSVLAFYFNNPSSNPAEAYNFSVNFVFEKNENEQKDAGDGPFKNIFNQSTAGFELGSFKLRS